MNEDGYEYEPHAQGKLKGFPWPVCKKCGHVYFTNPLSMWVLKMGCDHKWHPEYKTMLVKLVREHNESR